LCRSGSVGVGGETHDVDIQDLFSAVADRLVNRIVAQPLGNAEGLSHAEEGGPHPVIAASRLEAGSSTHVLDHLGGAQPTGTAEQAHRSAYAVAEMVPIQAVVAGESLAHRYVRYKIKNIAEPTSLTSPLS
jgi:hypothetical protein